MCVCVLCVCRVEVSDAVENVDMSLEELQQLLLRSHQQSAVEAGASTVMDVSRSALYTHTLVKHTDRSNLFRGQLCQFSTSSLSKFGT